MFLHQIDEVWWNQENILLLDYECVFSTFLIILIVLRIESIKIKIRNFNTMIFSFSANKLSKERYLQSKAAKTILHWAKKKFLNLSKISFNAYYVLKQYSGQKKTRGIYRPIISSHESLIKRKSLSFLLRSSAM